MDGDRRNDKIRERILDAAGSRTVPILHLPGEEAPEIWVWTQLTLQTEYFAEQLRQDPKQLADQLSKINRIFDSSSDMKANIAKSKLRTVGRAIELESVRICREVAFAETCRKSSDIQPLVKDLVQAITDWREPQRW